MKKLLVLFSMIFLGAIFTESTTHAFQANGRWRNSSISGSTGRPGSAISLSWGIVPDGTEISAEGNRQPSNLVATLDRWFGTAAGGLTNRPWFRYFQESFDRWSEVAGLTYVYEPNDGGAALDGSLTPLGNPGSYADVRIGGRFIDGQDGSNTLAFNYFPDHGDMVIDTSNTTFYSNTASNALRLRNVLMHEHGHGLGIGHVESNNGSFLMEPFIDVSFDGPQYDDILAAQRLYGDPWEKNGGNDSFLSPTEIGGFAVGDRWSIGTSMRTSRVAPSQSNFVSIDDDSDVDVFAFTIDAAADVTATLVPTGVTYNQGPQNGTQAPYDARAQSDLTLQFYDSLFGEVASADENGIREAEVVRGLPLQSGRHFVRVSGAQNAIQTYRLDLVFAPSRVPEPGALMLCLPIAFVFGSVTRDKRVRK